MPSSADAFDAAIDRAANAVQDAIAGLPAGGAAPIVLIDGQSGSGKTTLAGRLRERWPGTVQVVALDDIYPGWDGLSAGAEQARALILEPISRGQIARWHRWDWTRSAPGDAATTAPDAAVIIEGSGVLTAASAALAPVRVWLESPADTRRERALARDGDTYRPHWERWAIQEEHHLDVDHPRDLATIIANVP